ncbi:holo-ACP synthase [Neobacillus drentensis]|uniref:holo-ACP synthase n=1 Tax=Neobacillus drentensis TaxID=220684 RepID=UPI002FFDF13C
MYIGVDIIELERVSKLLNSGNQMLNIFTKNELDFANNFGAKRKIETLAGKFAAKEATAKALGTGFNGLIKPNEIEILNMDNGMPYLVLHNGSFEYANKLDIHEYHISISHNMTTAIAFVILA